MKRLCILFVFVLNATFIPNCSFEEPPGPEFNNYDDNEEFDGPLVGYDECDCVDSFDDDSTNYENQQTSENLEYFDAPPPIENMYPDIERSNFQPNDDNNYMQQNEYAAEPSESVLPPITNSLVDIPQNTDLNKSIKTPTISAQTNPPQQTTLPHLSNIYNQLEGAKESDWVYSKDKKKQNATNEQVKAGEIKQELLEKNNPFFFSNADCQNMKVSIVFALLIFGIFVN